MDFFGPLSFEGHKFDFFSEHLKARCPVWCERSRGFWLGRLASAVVRWDGFNVASVAVKAGAFAQALRKVLACTCSTLWPCLVSGSIAGSLLGLGQLVECRDLISSDPAVKLPINLLLFTISRHRDGPMERNMIGDFALI